MTAGRAQTHRSSGGKRQATPPNGDALPPTTSPARVKQPNYLGGEGIEIAQVHQALLDDVVVDIPVSMHEHVTEPNCGAHASRQYGRKLPAPALSRE
jgi:hypothetical protein